jgi:dTDP-4-amino-4,6-dideoxygalactose transaminase
MEALKDVKGVSIVKEPGDSRATYPFLTLIFEDIVKKVKVLKTLQGFGLGVSELYTLPISDYEYLKDFVPQRQYAGASYLANRQITLSTSTFLQDKDLDLVAKAIKNL